MTFSILAHDPETGAIGGAAATGSLCVGGWVLRGDSTGGMTASQGASPSTFWGEEVLSELRGGEGPRAAIDRITGADAGRDYRQIAALNTRGDVASFTGSRNVPEMGSLDFDGGIACGNMLRSITVLDAMAGAFREAKGEFDERLLAALRAGESEGGDSRGLHSAALLFYHPDRPPLTLRIDYHKDDPLGALCDLREMATTGAYADWTRQVPVRGDRERILD